MRSCVRPRCTLSVEQSTTLAVLKAMAVSELGIETELDSLRLRFMKDGAKKGLVLDENDMLISANVQDDSVLRLETGKPMVAGEIELLYHVRALPLCSHPYRRCIP